MFPILDERQTQIAGTLSGGERQMLAISRGLMSNPKLLMLDEPPLGLAPKIVEQMFEVIGELNSRGITILLVEQNIHHTLQIAHHDYVLETSRIALEVGPELRDNEHVNKAYLGIYPGKIAEIHTRGRPRRIARKPVFSRNTPLPAPRLLGRG